MKDLIAQVIIDEHKMGTGLPIESLLMLIDIRLCKVGKFDDLDSYLDAFERLNNLLFKFLPTEGEESRIFSQGAIDYIGNNPGTEDRFKAKRLAAYNKYQGDLVELCENYEKSKSTQGSIRG